MQPLLPLEPEIDRAIRLLGGSSTRLSLIGVAAPRLDPLQLRLAVRAATTASDICGILPDGGIGVLSLRGGDEFMARLEQQFAPGRRFTVLIRSVHCWSTEMRDTEDLIQTLLHTPARPVTVGARTFGMIHAVAARRARPAPLNLSGHSRQSGNHGN